MFTYIFQKQIADLLRMACNKLDTGNSTSTALGADEVFTGEWIDVINYHTFSVIYESDVAGATNALRIQFSVDGTNVIREKLVTPQLQQDGSGNYGGVHALRVVSQYLRIIYTNGSSPQSTFDLQTILSLSSERSLTSTNSQLITDSDDVLLTRSTIVGKTNSGFYSNVKIDTEDNLAISVPKAAFGEVKVIQETPVIQADFIYNINSDIVDTDTTNGTVTQANAMAVLSTSANASSHAEMSTVRSLKYRIGQGVSSKFTAVFTTGVAGSEQIIGIGDDQNGYFFGFNGTSFGIMRRSGGTDTWTAQENWDKDTMDGTGGSSNRSAQLLDPTKGNVFQIQFQWLGFGDILFSIEDTVTGQFVKVHTIEYANKNTQPSVLDPSFPILARVENTTNNTDIVLKTSSLNATIEGKIRLLGPRNAQGNDKTGVGTSYTNILTIRNKATFASKTNKVPVYISKYSVAVEGTKTATYEVILNGTLGGTPSYTDISTNASVIDYDTAGTTVTGGKIIDGGALGKSDSSTVTPFLEDIQLTPGDTLTIAVATSSGTTDATCFIKWIEDF